MRDRVCDTEVRFSLDCLRMDRLSLISLVKSHLDRACGTVGSTFHLGTRDGSYTHIALSEMNVSEMNVKIYDLQDISASGKHANY